MCRPFLCVLIESKIETKLRLKCLNSSAQFEYLQTLSFLYNDSVTMNGCRKAYIKTMSSKQAIDTLFFGEYNWY